MRSRLLLLAAVVLFVACSDVTGPGTRHAVGITSINTSAHAGALDTIWISFYPAAAPCDTGVIVATEYTSRGMRFSASSVITTTGACPLYPAALAYVPPRVFVVVPPHMVPFEARFAQPGGPDSVRTIGP